MRGPVLWDAAQTSFAARAAGEQPLVSTKITRTTTRGREEKRREEKRREEKRREEKRRLKCSG
jgi:hypothetical protein